MHALLLLLAGALCDSRSPFLFFLPRPRLVSHHMLFSIKQSSCIADVLSFSWKSNVPQCCQSIERHLASTYRCCSLTYVFVPSVVDWHTLYFSLPCYVEGLPCTCVTMAGRMPTCSFYFSRGDFDKLCFFASVRKRLRPSHRAPKHVGVSRNILIGSIS